MLDLIILIFLIDYIGKSARSKGMNVLSWRFRLFFGWMGAEMLIGLISFFITRQIFIAALSGFLGGVLAGFIIFQWFFKEANSLKNEGL